MADWVRTLLDPATQIHFAVNGFTAVLSTWCFYDRTLPETLLYYTAEGAVEGQIEGKPFTLEPRSCLAMAADIEHSFHGQRDHMPSVYHIRIDVQSDGCRVTHDEPMIVLSGVPTLEALFEQIHDEHMLARPLAIERQHGLLAMAYVGIHRLQQRQHEPDAGLNAAQRRRLFRYVSRNAAHWPTPAELAEELRLSHDYFTRLFTTTFGIPPRTWLMHDRIQRAAIRLSESQLSISEVAAEFGYNEPFLFSRQFKQVIGVSPRAYRQSRR